MHTLSIYLLHNITLTKSWSMYYMLKNICCASHSPGPRVHPWGVKFSKYPYFTITWAARYYQAAHCIPGGVMWAAKSRPHLTHIYPHSIYTQDHVTCTVYTPRGRPSSIRQHHKTDNTIARSHEGNKLHQGPERWRCMWPGVTRVTWL